MEPVPHDRVRQFALDNVGLHVAFRARPAAEEGGPAHEFLWFSGAIFVDKKTTQVIRAQRFDIEKVQRATAGSDDYVKFPAPGWEYMDIMPAVVYTEMRILERIKARDDENRVAEEKRRAEDKERHEHQLREARARAVEQALGTQAAKTAKSKRGAKAQKPPPKPAHTELDTPTDASLETANSDRDDTAHKETSEPHWVRKLLEAQTAVLKTMVGAKSGDESEAEEEGFRPYSTKTWKTYMGTAEGHDLLETKLRTAYGVHAGSSEKKVRRFDLLMSWVRSASAVEDWEDSPLKVLGDDLLIHLRDIVSEEKGLNTEKIRTEMYPQRHPGDKYGAAAAKQEKEGRTTTATGKRTPGRKLKCWYCGVTGHAAQKCFKRKEDGAPMPTGPRSGNESRGDEGQTRKGTK